MVDFDQSTTTMKEERNKTLCWMNQISYYDPSCYITTPNTISSRRYHGVSKLLIGRSGGRQGRAHPSRFNFFDLHTVFGEGGE